MAIEVGEEAAVEVAVELPEADEALLEDEVLREVAVEVLEGPKVVACAVVTELLPGAVAGTE